MRDNIERNEIVKNILPIRSFEQLSYSIFQDETLIEDSKKANECLKYLIENLQKAYNLIDTLDEGGYFDNKENEVTKLRDDFDLYQMGDIINFLETIKIKRAKTDKKLYKCVADWQGGNWAVGMVGDLKYWRDLAICWAESDESYGLVRALTRYEIKNEDLIDYISDYWQIEIEEVD